MGRKKGGDDAPVQTGKNKKKNVVVDDDEYAILDDQSVGDAPLALSVAEDELSASLQGMALSTNKTSNNNGNKSRVKGNKKGKKDVDDGDEGFQKNTAEVDEEEVSQISFVGKKRGKKGKQSNRDDEDADDVNLGSVDGDGAADGNGDVKKNKKKGGGKAKPKASQADMFSVLAEFEDEGETESTVLDSLPVNDDFNVDESSELVFTGKKKSKDNRKGLVQKQDENVVHIVEPERGGGTSVNMDEPSELVFTGKKKKKDKKSATEEQKHEFDDNKETLDAEEADLITFSGKKKKSSKGGQKKIDEEMEYSVLEAKEEDEDAIVVLPGTKKTKGKNNKSLFANSSFAAALTDEEDTEDKSMGDNIEVEEKYRKGDDEMESDVEEAIQFTGKKKAKKGKKANANANVLVPDAETLKQEEHGAGDEAPPSVATDLAATSKKQKQKKKKSGRTVQEEEDLDKILAELGEGPAPPPKPALEEVPKSESVVPQPAESVIVAEEATAEPEGLAESAAAKKKKKKKEKEKGKKAAAAAVEDKAEEERPEEPKSKIPDKKVPKHVREMQERLAKMKEAEERKKQEEEEKQRKEEEERLRLEELEREKEEAKRRKKEREKEKMLKKKQEGKLLTGKKKEEARRLAIMREQFLAQSGVSSDISKEENHTMPKKPKYETKKKRHGPIVADAVAAEQVAVTTDHDALDDSHLPEEAGAMEVEHVEIQPDVEMEEEKLEIEEEEEEEDDWDAKSWDEKDVALSIKSAFAEEEESPIAKKVTKRVVVPASKTTSVPTSTPTAMNVAKSVPPVKPAPPVKKVQEAQPESEEESESEETDSGQEDTGNKKRGEATTKREARKAEALSKRSSDDLRSPICCILGHVDTGKTKLLDCIRRTNVQEGEAGGITQQIGATYFPMENIRERTKELKADANLRVPGLLVIDTPGHESFTNLRSRGSGLCDIAILVIDIMHGLEPQTIESLNLLKMRHTPFVVALNKVDRLYAWKSRPNAPIRTALKQQSKDVQNEFEHRLSQIITELKEQGLNSELYYRNKEVRKYVSIVPTSAISGEGVPDLLLLLIQSTQKLMEERLMYISEVQCTVLEVKVIEGLGTTIDVILINGVLHEGDQIVVCGMQGPIVTSIRALLTPHPMKELRIKGSYQHHKELKAAQGIKITGQGLEHAIAGTQLHVVGPEDDLEDLKDEAMQDMKNVMSRIDKSGEGVCVQASTLGSLEALLEFLKSPAVNIPVSGINIGPVHKKDIMRSSVMLEKKKKEYAAILAFDVKVTPEARELADELGVKIFMADIIYHLFDQFKAYVDNIKEEKKKESAEEAVFPCVLKILPNCVFNKKDPIIVGVDVLEGIARVGTPLCVPTKEFIDIGRISSIEINHKAVDSARKGQQVAMKIIGNSAEEAQKMIGRHFEAEDELVSHVTRRSIDILKENYRDDLTLEDWKFVLKLKKLFKIP